MFTVVIMIKTNGRSFYLSHCMSYLALKVIFIDNNISNTREFDDESLWRYDMTIRKLGLIYQDSTTMPTRLNCIGMFTILIVSNYQSYLDDVWG